MSDHISAITEKVYFPLADTTCPKCGVQGVSADIILLYKGLQGSNSTLECIDCSVEG